MSTGVNQANEVPFSMGMASSAEFRFYEREGVGRST